MHIITLLNRHRGIDQVVRNYPCLNTGIEHGTRRIDARTVSKRVRVLQNDTSSFDVVPVPGTYTSVHIVNQDLSDYGTVVTIGVDDYSVYGAVLSNVTAASPV
jgi:hypothetical protein